MEKMCVGNHEARKNVRCSLQEVSCGRLCGKSLSCGVHKCRKSCHSGSCLDHGNILGADASIGCGNACAAKLVCCGHLCQAKCHPGKTCPAISCKQKVLESFSLIYKLKITITCACK